MDDQKLKMMRVQGIKYLIKDVLHNKYFHSDRVNSICGCGAMDVDVALWMRTSTQGVSVAKAMRARVKLLCKEHAMVQGQAK
jgi:hypothetical protein